MGLEAYVPLISGLIGALIGSLGSVAVVLIQSVKEDRRHRRELAMQLSLADRDAHIAIANSKEGGAIYPISLYLAYHSELIDALSRGKLTAQSLREQRVRMDALVETINDIEKEARAKRKRRNADDNQN